MKLPHKCFEFRYRVLTVGIGIFRCHIVSRQISPIVQFYRRYFRLRRGRIRDRSALRSLHAFLKLINGLHHNPCDAQFFQIRDLFLYTRKGARLLYSGRIISRKTTDMQTVVDTVLISGPRSFIPPPVKLIRNKTTVFQSILPAGILMLCPEQPVPHKTLRINIHHRFAVFMKEIVILL